jgi:MoaA/NifB/PqqE/SkfB family radical SAM enzyme
MKGSNFDLVVNNLKRMIAINKYITFLKINPTKDNVHQLKDIKKFMKDLGGYPDNTVVSATGLSLPTLATEQEKEEFLSKVVGGEKEIERFLCFNYFKNKKGKVVIKPKKPIKACTMLIDSIWFDGRVTVCAHDSLGKASIGNAFETPLKTIRKSSQYKDIYSKAKRRALDFCKDCN